MRFRSFAAALLLLAACTHTPALQVAENPNPAGTDGEETDVPDEPLEEEAVTLNGEPDRIFLEQSLELALNPWNATRLATDLRAFVAKSSQKNRLWVRDPIINKVRRLTLERIHTERITPFNDGTAAICVDFKDDNGDRIDMDFFLIRSDTGTFERITGQDIHRVNEQARFSYLEKDGAWVRSARNLTTPKTP